MKIDSSTRISELRLHITPEIVLKSIRKSECQTESFENSRIYDIKLNDCNENDYGQSPRTTEIRILDTWPV